MNTNISKKLFSNATMVVRVRDTYKSPKSLFSRVLIILGIFLFGTISGSFALLFLLMNPQSDQHTKAVTAFIILGSLVLCVLSSLLLFLLIIGAYINEKIERVNAESIESEIFEYTGQIAHQMLIDNLLKPEFRDCLRTILSQKDNTPPNTSEIISLAYFSKVDVKKAADPIISAGGSVASTKV
ncbi:hypothetical protein Pan153_24000 [Gimesia panareensis]|uniref:Uncharacterized protein n=1 Tax=Gimesia panareensis TaxID=2527978 RepID=A0A518FNA1_9PLAN|nr:hypothetical protein [Gimesia panareensis]QDV17745.1 hypothetical protein Pan153_24000 [Gimesia panareensis]